MTFSERIIDLVKREATAEIDREAARLQQRRQKLNSDQLAEQRTQLARLRAEQADLERELPAVLAEHEKRKTALEDFRTKRLNPLVWDVDRHVMAIISVEMRVEQLERQAAAQAQAIAALVPPAGG